MTLFFWLQLVAYLLSLLALSDWINAGLRKVLRLDAIYLPVWSWGWSVYFALYFVGRQLGIATDAARSLYATIAFGVAGIALVLWGWRWRQGWRPPRWLASDLGTITLVGLFVVGAITVGPYLEFPSDPVDYFYRIQAWEKARWLSYSGLGDYATFVNFSNHWLLHATNVDVGDRWGVAVVASVWQAILFWEFIRLGRFLTDSRSLSWLAGVLSLGYFGYDAISFYRYATFASSMLAQIVYLEALLVIFAIFLTERWRYAILLLPLLIVGADAHLQAVLLQLNALLGCATLSLLCRYRTLARSFRRGLLGLLGLGLGLSMSVLPRTLVMENLDPVYRNLHIFNLAAVWDGTVFLSRYWPMSKVLGLVGWLTLLAALLVLLYRQPDRRLDLSAMVAIWPLFVLFNPLFVGLLMRFMAAELLHRLFYGSLYWLFLVACLQAVSQDLRQRQLPIVQRITMRWQRSPLGRQYLTQLKQPLVGVIGVGLVGLSWLPNDPVYGNSAHFWHRVDPQLDGSDLQPAIRYLRSHAPPDCADPFAEVVPHLHPIRAYVLSDPYVNTYLLNTGYFHTATNRSSDRGAYETPALGLTTQSVEGLTYAQFRDTLQAFQVCYVVIYLPDKTAASWLGATSGHWFAEYAQPQRFYSPQFLRWVRRSPAGFELVFEQDGVQIFRVIGF